MRGFILFAILFFAIRVFAQFEYSFDASYRNNPPGGSVTALGAYNYLIWGEKKSPGDFMYGFVKAGASAAAHEEFTGFLEMHPISIVNLSLTQSSTFRNYKIDPFDCTQYVCNGEVKRTIAKASFVVGYANTYLIPAYSETHISHQDQSRPLALESENLVIKAGGDKQRTQSVALIQVIDDFTIGLYYRKAHMLDSDVDNEAGYLITREKLKEQNLSLYSGLGSYGSSFEKKDFSFFLGVEYDGGETLSLF